MKRHAVIIAGDTRTWKKSAWTLAPLLKDADVFVSVWKSSEYSHQVTRQKYWHHAITAWEVDKMFSRLRGLHIEEYVPDRWAAIGYNANYLHRLRVGISLLRPSSENYESVTLIRPDLIFNVDDDNYKVLVDKIREVTAGQVISVMSRNFLNDWLLAVVPDDLDKVVPTVDQYAPHRHEDWHTFHRTFVSENGMQVVDVPHVPVLINRPSKSAPEGSGTYNEAYRNACKWNNEYIYRLIEREGLSAAMRAWGTAGVINAVRDLADSDEWKT